MLKYHHHAISSGELRCDWFHDSSLKSCQPSLLAELKDMQQV